MGLRRGKKEAEAEGEEGKGARDPQHRTQSVTMNPLLCTSGGVPSPPLLGARHVRPMPLEPFHASSSEQSQDSPSRYPSVAAHLAPPLGYRPLGPSPPRPALPLLELPLWVPAALDKSLRGSEVAASSVEQRAEVSFLRPGAPPPAPPCVPVYRTGSGPGRSCFLRGAAKLRAPGTYKGEPGKLKGVQISLAPPHPALQLPTPRPPWSALSGRPGSLVLVATPVAPGTRPGWRAVAGRPRPGTRALYLILEPERTSLLAGLPGQLIPRDNSRFHLARDNRCPQVTGCALGLMSRGVRGQEGLCCTACDWRCWQTSPPFSRQRKPREETWFL